MSKIVFTRLLSTLMLLLVVQTTGNSQEVEGQHIRLMFYNVENLFDIHDDSLKDDNEFLPSGQRRWNFTRYSKKINSLYKTIVAAGEWSPPAIVALCEIENREVLEDLIYGTYLSKSNYNIVHEDSPDLRGIDVCLIYRKDLVDIINYSYWIPPVDSSDKFISRSILYTKFLINDDTLHLIVNHWPSRRGGVLAAEDQRKSIALMIKNKADSLINKSNTGAKIILLGDFNCSPEDQVMRSLLSHFDASYSLINLSEKPAAIGLGTYRYMGVWEMIDQIIVSDELLTYKTGLYTEPNMFRIFKPDFLLCKDPKYPGFTPFSTYRGFRYQGGYSDHLPVMLDIMFRQAVQQE